MASARIALAISAWVTLATFASGKCGSFTLRIWPNKSGIGPGEEPQGNRLISNRAPRRKANPTREKDVAFRPYGTDEGLPSLLPPTVNVRIRLSPRAHCQHSDRVAARGRGRPGVRTASYS